VHMLMARTNALSPEDNMAIPNQVSRIFEILLSSRSFDGVRERVDSTTRLAAQFSDYWKLYGCGEWERRECENMARLVIRETWDFVHSISQYCVAIWAHELTIDEKADLFDVVCLSNLFGRLASDFKVAVNIVFARFFRTERPAIPDGYFGKFLLPRWLNHRLNLLITQSREKVKMRHCIQIYSLFQGVKKGLLPIRADQIDKSLVKHMKALTEKVETDRGILGFARRLLDREFRNLRLKEDRLDAILALEPLLSTKATVEVSRTKGGQVGWAVQELDNPHFYLEPRDVVLRVPVFVGFARCSTRVEAIYSSYYSDREIREELDYKEKWGSIPNLVEPSVVLEPLKGRIITKPSVGAYRNLNGLQDILRRKISKYRQFEVGVKRPIETTDIWYLASDYSVGKGWCSGDYSSATDLLHADFSLTILDHILGPKAKYDWIRESFTGAKISYEKQPLHYEEEELGARYVHWNCTDNGVVQQANGQLMGHVLSFPILCLANYIVFRYSYYLMKKKAPKVLVNGDDILFLCEPDEYQTWLKVVQEVGFVPSLGKNLFQADICQINSELFRISYIELDQFRRVVRNVEQVPYLNFGLIRNRGKGKEVEKIGAKTLGLDNLDALPLQTVLPNVVDLITNQRWDSNFAERAFWREHKKLCQGVDQVFDHKLWREKLPRQLWYKSIRTEGSSIQSRLIGERFSHSNSSAPIQDSCLKDLYKLWNRTPLTLVKEDKEVWAWE